ncbi:hypothetical protein ACCO45_005751 [Purpureocillium lilacinum]|uniref:Uncharacterized protein n=1 Tax=Purpureocillium lilacinum TaxID=33203 RepID=A0ACC4DWC5_PURLI
MQGFHEADQDQLPSDLISSQRARPNRQSSLGATIDRDRPLGKASQFKPSPRRGTVSWHGSTKSGESKECVVPYFVAGQTQLAQPVEPPDHSNRDQFVPFIFVFRGRRQQTRWSPGCAFMKGHWRPSRPTQARQEPLSAGHTGAPNRCIENLFPTSRREDPDGTKFRFIFCSSKYAEKTKKSFPFVNDPRRYVTDAEKGLCEVADANKAKFEAYILRPASFYVSDMPSSQPTTPTKKLVGGHSTSTIDTSQVGKAMVAVALDGWKDRIVENDFLVKM